MFGADAIRCMRRGNGGGGDTDPYWNNVVSLIYPSGPDGSTTFSDETGLRTWSRSGGAVVNTSVAPFAGAGSIAMDGSGDYLTTSHGADFNLSGDFTLELFAMNNNIGPVRTFVAKRTSYAGYFFAHTTVPFFTFIGNPSTDLIGDTPMTQGVWHHIAVCNDATSARMYLDGVKIAEMPSVVMNANTSMFYLGRDPNNTSRDWNGYISQFRITNGAARYTADFTPPTEPLDRKSVV